MFIRLATIADAPRLRDLNEVTFIDTYAPFNTSENLQMHVDNSFNLAQIERELEQENVVYFVVKLDDQLIAFAKLVLDHTAEGLGSQKAVEIERFYVLPAFHGRQVAQQLMAHCCDWAFEATFQTIWLGVWEHNPRAFRFYQKLGFQHFGNHIFTLGTDAQTDLLMKKDF